MTKIGATYGNELRIEMTDGKHSYIDPETGELLGVVYPDGSIELPHNKRMEEVFNNLFKGLYTLIDEAESTELELFMGAYVGDEYNWLTIPWRDTGSFDIFIDNEEKTLYQFSVVKNPYERDRNENQ